MKHLPLRECGYAIAVVVVLLLLYGGAYLATMQRVELLGRPNVAPMATYRIGGEWAENFFGPAHELDRRLRPELWVYEFDMRLFRRGFRLAEDTR